MMRRERKELGTQACANPKAGHRNRPIRLPAQRLAQLIENLEFQLEAQMAVAGGLVEAARSAALTIDKSAMSEMRAPWDEVPRRCSGHLPDDALRIVMRGADKEDRAAAA